MPTQHGFDHYFGMTIVGAAGWDFTVCQPDQSRDKVTSIRDGRWKLHVSRRDQQLPEPELYDIEADPQEKNSLTNTAPDVVARLQSYVDQFQKQVPHTWRLYYPVRDAAKEKSGIRRQ